MSRIEEFKVWFRDHKCARALGEGPEILPTRVSQKRSFLKGGFFYRNKRKYVNQLVSMGAVLTGSAALGLFTVNGVDIFNRGPGDLDWVLGKDEFMRFCGMNDFVKVKVSDSVCTFCFHTGHYGGFDSYGQKNMDWLYTGFDVIGRDDSFYHHELDGLKVMDYMEILEKKLVLAEMDKRSSKHEDDLFAVMTKIMAFG